MNQPDIVTPTRLRTPKSAAIAGILFSVLLTTAFWLLRLYVPTDPHETGDWLESGSRGYIVIALNLIPVAGISFLWFIGVLRDRLGAAEDRFFATVLFGSGLLMLSTLFITAAMAGGLIAAFASQPEAVLNSAAFHFARAATYSVMNVYTVKMAGVFMISTSTIIAFTEIVPRWIAFIGYALALLIFFGGWYFERAFVCFPAWVFLISAYILTENAFRARSTRGAG